MEFCLQHTYPVDPSAVHESHPAVNHSGLSSSSDAVHETGSAVHEPCFTVQKRPSIVTRFAQQLVISLNKVKREGSCSPNRENTDKYKSQANKLTINSPRRARSVGTHCIEEKPGSGRHYHTSIISKSRDIREKSPSGVSEYSAAVLRPGRDYSKAENGMREPCRLLHIDDCKGHQDADLSFELGIFGYLRPKFFKQLPQMTPEMMYVYQEEHKVYWRVVQAQLLSSPHRS
jgi:hypothetical protein